MKAKNKEEYVDKLTRKFASTISHVEQMKALAHAGHTPGPWYTSGTGNHQGLVIAEQTGANICVTYDKKDSDLIAAAPDLLDFVIQYLYSEHGICAPHHDAAPYSPEELKAMSIRLIAKAEGENK